MAAFYDFLLDANGDLLIQNGDFVIGASDEQHIQDIIESFTGWWKEFPTVGVGIKQYQGSAGQEQKTQQSIALQLAQDGYDVGEVTVEAQPNSTFLIYTDATRN